MFRGDAMFGFERGRKACAHASRARSFLHRCYGPLKDAPKATGCSEVESQRQRPFSVFLNVKAFSIRRRCVTAKASRLPGCAGPGLPFLRSQQVPVQFDAIELHAANGASTTISIPAVISAFWSATSLSTS